MGAWSGTYTDTVGPRCERLFAQLECMKLLWRTLDFTAADPDEQAEAHFYLDLLQGWMEAVKEWDRAAGGVMPGGGDGNG
jgi:hypothetical protein